MLIAQHPANNTQQQWLRPGWEADKVDNEPDNDDDTEGNEESNEEDDDEEADNKEDEESDNMIIHNSSCLQDEGERARTMKLNGSSPPTSAGTTTVARRRPLHDGAFGPDRSLILYNIYNVI